MAAALAAGSSPRVQAAALLVLALPQIYLLPKDSSDVSLSTFLTILLAIGVLIRFLRRPTRRPFPDMMLFGTLGLLLGLRVIAVAWSPEPSAALQPVVLLGSFLVVLLLMLDAVPLLKYIERLYWPFVGLEIFLVVLFRFAPGVEGWHLRHLGGYFAGQNAVAALFDLKNNNVFDPAKAGGVFVNANVAAMFLGVNGLAALAVYAVTRTRWVGVLGAVSILSVLVTGSKSAAVLAVTLPVLAVGAIHLSRSTMPARQRYRLFGGIAAAAAAAVGVMLAIGALRRALVNAFVGRTEIWGFGAESFAKKPIQGLGFGGWDAGFPAYAQAHHLYRSFPPHNLLLATWAATGIPGLILTLAFLVLAFRVIYRALSGRVPVDKRFAAFAGAAIAWIFIQGMGENTDVFGEIHLIPIVALLYVLLIKPIGEEDPGDVTDAHRRHSATPAVPAVGDVHPQPGSGTTYLSTTFRGEGPGPGDHAASQCG